MAQSGCWGVEVGAGAVKAVKLVRDGEGVAVADFAVIPHKRPLSSPEIDEKEAKRVALGALISQHDVVKSQLAISVPGHTAFARFAKLPPVEPKKIPDIVKFEAVQQIPFPIEEVEWDYQTFAAPDSPDVEVGIFAMTAEKVKEKLEKWKDLGVTPQVLTLSPLAAYNALSYEMQFTESTPGTVILDVGTTSTDLIVAEAGRLWIRTFPIGGHNFTEALVSAFNLSYNKAEKLKREAETTQHTRHVLQALRPVFGDLAQDVQRSMGYYSSLHREAKLTRLVGLGETFNLPGLRKFLSQQLQIEVTRLESYSRIKCKDEAKDAEFQKHAMTMATALGCALQGLGYETIGANLMPVSVVREAVWTRKNPWWMAAAGLGLLAGGAAFIRPMIDKAALASASRPPVIDQVKSEARALKSKWGEIESAFKPDPRAATAVALTQGRSPYVHILEDFGAMMAAAQAESPKYGGPDTRLQFRSLDTAYGTKPRSDDKAKPSGAAPPPGGDDEAAASADPTAKPRVHMTLEIAVSKPIADAEKFVNNAIAKWLTDNAERPTAAYTIDKATVKWIRSGEFKIAEGGGESGFTPAPQPAGTGGGRPAPGGRTGAPPPRGGGGGPGGEGGGRRGPGGEPGGSRTTPRSETEGAGGSAPPSGPAGTVGGITRPKSVDDMNKVAPVPPPDPLGPPGSTVYTFTILWDAILVPPTPPAAAKPADGAPAPTGGAK